MVGPPIEWWGTRSGLAYQICVRAEGVWSDDCLLPWWGDPFIILGRVGLSPMAIPIQS